MLKALAFLGKAFALVAFTAICVSAGGQYAERISNVSKGSGKHVVRRAVKQVYYNVAPTASMQGSEYHSEQGSEVAVR